MTELLTGDIKDTVVVQGAEQGSGDRKVRTTADPQREYVAAGKLQVYTDFLQALSHSIDDITRDFGADEYEQMLLDPQIEACLTTLKTAVLAGGLIINAFELPDDADDADLQLTKTLADFCKQIIDDLETLAEDVLWNMLDAVWAGNKVAETVWIMGDGWEDGPKLELRRINVKSRDAVAFVVDQFNNVVGILGAVPGIGLPVLEGSIIGDSQVANLLPRQKFFIYTFRPEDNDPRGTSILRSLHNIWWIGQQLLPEWLKYLSQFATAILVGFTPENAQPVVQEDSEGNPVIDPTTGQPVLIYPEDAMAQTLVKVRNGSVVVFRGGSEVEAIKPDSSGGEAFLEAFDLIGRMKSQVILHQTLATQEGEHQARAASEVHQDIFELLIQSIKRGLLRAFRRDVLMPLVRYNYGEEAVRFTPTASLGETEQQDFSTVATAVSTLWTSKYLDPSQVQATDELLGLPARPPEAIQRLIEQAALGLEMLQAGVDGAKAQASAGGKPNEQGRPQSQRPAQPPANGGNSQGRGQQ